MVRNKLILGTAQLGIPAYGINNSNKKLSDDNAFGILDTAAESGILYLDTAEAYGDSEQVIGRYLRNNPSVRFKVITKFHSVEGGEIERKVEESLERLAIDQIDTLLFHSYKEYLLNPGILDRLSDQKEQGRIGKIGVSVYSNHEIEDLLTNPRIDVIQAPFNLLDSAPLKTSLFTRAQSEGRYIHTRSAFLQGLFFLPENQIPDYLIKLKPYLSELKSIASKSGLLINEMALSYAITRKYIDSVLVGVETKEQLLDNVRASKRRLDPDVVSKIESVVVENKNLLNPALWKI